MEGYVTCAADGVVVAICDGDRTPRAKHVAAGQRHRQVQQVLQLNQNVHIALLHGSHKFSLLEPSTSFRYCGADALFSYEPMCAQ